MAKIISIIGNKGGTGKTTISHMLSQGLGDTGCYTVAVLTDCERDKLSRNGRSYLPFDARSAENLEKVAAKLANTPEWFGVFDGGANRTDVDRKLAAMSDVVLLPFRDSEEDIRALIQDLERFPKAYALPSQWPTNVWQKMTASKLVSRMLAGYEDRIIAPVYNISVSKMLLRGELEEKLPSHLNNACRAITQQVLELIASRESRRAGMDPATLPAIEVEEFI